MKAHPEAEYDSALFDSLIGVPWNPLGKQVGDQDDTAEEIRDVPPLPRVLVPRAAFDPPASVRRALITRNMVDHFGVTPGCIKCRAIRIGDQTQPALAHNADCRARMEQLMAEDDKFKKNLERAEQRRDEYLAQRVEAGDYGAKRVRTAEVELEPGPGGG